MPDRPWTEDERIVARAASSIPHPGEGAWLNAGTFRSYWQAVAAAVLDALTAVGWEPRCDCDGVAHDLPILRSHIRGEPGCKAASSDKGSTDA